MSDADQSPPVMSGGPVWDHCRSFLAVMAEGSLSGAARALGLTQPTLARHIELLEQALGGQALFTRSPQGLRPTEAAQRLLPHAEAMAAAAASFSRAATGDPDQLSGAVRLTASEMIGVEVLPPILRDLRIAQPGLDFELALSNEQADLLRRDADIAVRMTRPRQSALVARKVGVTRIGLFAHRDYIARAGMPERLDDLKRHAGIGYDAETQGLRALVDLGMDIRREDFALRTDSEHAQLAALRAGFGIGGCQLAIARRDPSLVRVLEDLVSFELEIWIVMHGDLASDRRMRVVFDHLAAAMRAYAKE